MSHLPGHTGPTPATWVLENIHIVIRFMFSPWLTVVDDQWEGPFISEGASD